MSSPEKPTSLVDEIAELQDMVRFIPSLGSPGDRRERALAILSALETELNDLREYRRQSLLNPIEQGGFRRTNLLERSFDQHYVTNSAVTEQPSGLPCSGPIELGDETGG